MKPINPITNTVYRRGDVCADGRLFISYHLKHGKYYLQFGTKEYLEELRHKTKVQKNNSKQRSLNMLNGCHKRCMDRNMDFDLTYEWIKSRLDAGVCELSGEKFVMSDLDRSSHYSPYSPSLDRIDSTKGYTQDNCRVILTAINLAINQFGLDAYLTLAKKVIAKQKKILSL